jgi:hypothetical protein
MLTLQPFLIDVKRHGEVGLSNIRYRLLFRQCLVIHFWSVLF